MAVLFEGKGFEAIGRLKAIVAVGLLFCWQGFWQNIFVQVLSIFDCLCYFEIGRRNRTLKTKYSNGSTTLQLQLL